MPYPFATKLLTNCLIASGSDRESAERAADDAMGILESGKVLDKRHSESWELYAQIDQMSLDGKSPTQIRIELNVPKQTVSRALWFHVRRKRAALRYAEKKCCAG